MATDRRYGQIDGLPQRFADWVDRVKRDKSLPFVGLGIIADMEAVLRLLSLEEFGEWLRNSTDPELAAWGKEVLNAVDRTAELDTLQEDISDAMEGPGGDTYNDDVATLAADRAELGRIRSTLVELGVLAEGDTDTPLAPLITAVLC